MFTFFFVVFGFAANALLFIIFHKLDDMHRESKHTVEQLRIVTQVLEQIRRGDIRT